MALLETAPVAETLDKTIESLEKETNIFFNYFQKKFPDIVTFGIKILIAIVAFFIGRLIIKWICRFVRRALERSAVDKGVEQFVHSLVKATLYILLIVILITNLGVETTSLAALVASGGVAIGLALQGSLSNFAGGVLILLLKPFIVGDYIIEDGNNNEGTVKEIQLFYTKLSTVDNKTVIIPNGSLANTSMTNVTARDIRQLDLQIAISYDSDLKKAKKVMEHIIANNPAVIKEEEHLVFVSDLANHGVIIGVRGWVKTSDFSAVRWEILEEIKLTLDDSGINIAVWPQV